MFDRHSQHSVTSQVSQIMSSEWGIICFSINVPCTPVFLLENPMNRGAWWATVHGVINKWDTTEQPARMHKPGFKSQHFHSPASSPLICFLFSLSLSFLLNKNRDDILTSQGSGGGGVTRWQHTPHGGAPDVRIPPSTPARPPLPAGTSPRL